MEQLWAIHKITLTYGVEKQPKNQSKLELYRRVKLNFGLESYINNTTYHARKNIACIRSSAHDLNIERGRYASRLSHPHLWTSPADTAVPEKPEKDSRYLSNSHSAPNKSLNLKNTHWLAVQRTMESEWALMTILNHFWCSTSFRL